MMIPPQDPLPNEKSPLHWVLCYENWGDPVFIAVPDLNTTLIDSNYSNVSTQDIKRSYFDEETVNAESQERNPKE